MADVRTEETTTSWSTASGLLWIALNKVGTWTLIQVELLPHTVRSTLTQLDVLYKKKKKMNLHVLILLIFVHLYRFVLGLFVCFVVFCCCCTVMISSEMTLFQVSLCFSPFSSLPSGFSHLKKMNLHTAARTSGGFCEACCWTAGHICVASNRQSETLRLLKILNKLQMSVWFDTSEVWIFNFSCYVIQLFWWTHGSLLADVWSSSFWLQLWLEEWVT